MTLNLNHRTPTALSAASNPVLDADWSDPDVIRAGDRYVMVASSFSRVPGLPVLVSNDLVTWTIASHALERLSPASHFDLPRHGHGVWAPVIRFHAGEFHIFYPDPDRGIFVVRSPSPFGPWSEPTLVLAGLGIIDPCPFWDDDGRVYLVAAWAFSRSGVRNRLSIVELDSTATVPISPLRTLIDGDAVEGCSTLEGPKIHRRGDSYLVFAPAGGVATGWQLVFRSFSLDGPWEVRTVLEQGDTAINGPHQGSWIDGPHGEDRFIHFQDTGAYGRVVHLQPLTWSDDGWPEIGAQDDAGRGVPVARVEPLALSVAAAAAAAGTLPRLGSALDATAWSVAGAGVDGAGVIRHLAPQWHWQANRGDDWATFPDDGTLRLATVPGDVGNLRALGQVLARRLTMSTTRVTTTVSVRSGIDGARAGLVVLGVHYAWIGLEVSGGIHRLVCRAFLGEGDEIDLIDAVPVTVDELSAVTVGFDISDGVATAFWTVGGESGATSGGSSDGSSAGSSDSSSDSSSGRASGRAEHSFTIREGTWVGAETGVFAAAPVGSSTTGDDDVAVFGEFLIGVRSASQETS